jgi:hypothetical protein
MPVMNGAHKRLQQSVHAPHTVPSTPVQLVAPLAGCPQTPMVLPEAMVHTPPQHWLPFEQMSPFCTQYDEAIWHRPFEQSLEQHWVLNPPSPVAVHGSPAMLQFDPALMTAQVLPPPSPPWVQLPPQH